MRVSQRVDLLEVGHRRLTGRSLCRGFSMVTAQIRVTQELFS